MKAKAVQPLTLILGEVSGALLNPLLAPRGGFEGVVVIDVVFGVYVATCRCLLVFVQDCADFRFLCGLSELRFRFHVCLPYLRLSTP